MSQSGTPLRLTPDHIEKLARGIEQNEVSIIAADGDGWLTMVDRTFIAQALRQASSETQLIRAEEAAWMYSQVFAVSNDKISRDHLLRVIRDRLYELNPRHPIFEDSHVGR